MSLLSFLGPVKGGIQRLDKLILNISVVGVHLRDSGCTQESVYLLNILVYRYLILTFYKKRVFSSISG